MSERQKPHNGRDKSGHYRVRHEDVEELRAQPEGADFVRDDVRLGGAIADTGVAGAERGKKIENLIEQNRDDVEQAAETD